MGSPATYRQGMVPQVRLEDQEEEKEVIQDRDKMLAAAESWREQYCHHLRAMKMCEKEYLLIRNVLEANTIEVSFHIPNTPPEEDDV